MSVPGAAIAARVKRVASVPKRFDNFQRIDDVDLWSYGHFLAIGVADQGCGCKPGGKGHAVVFLISPAARFFKSLDPVRGLA